jgi:hypothetical protein
LIATDAGVAVSQTTYRLATERNHLMPRIEHDKIVAETVHFEERHLCHGSGYMAAMRCISNAGAVMGHHVRWSCWKKH